MVIFRTYFKDFSSTLEHGAHTCVLLCSSLLEKSVLKLAKWRLHCWPPLGWLCRMYVCERHGQTTRDRNVCLRAYHISGPEVKRPCCSWRSFLCCNSQFMLLGELHHWLCSLGWAKKTCMRFSQPLITRWTASRTLTEALPPNMVSTPTAPAKLPCSYCKEKCCLHISYML